MMCYISLYMYMYIYIYVCIYMYIYISVVILVQAELAHCGRHAMGGMGVGLL